MSIVTSFIFTYQNLQADKRQSTITMIRYFSDCAFPNGINIDGYIDIGIKISSNFKELKIWLIQNRWHCLTENMI